MKPEPGQLCKEPGCRFPASTRPSGRCESCRGSSRCDGRPHRRKCENLAVHSTLCRPCAEREHPGELFFRGRWRTAEAAALVIVSDRANRFVKWETREGQLIGRLGGYLIALNCDGEKVLRMMKGESA